jgi:hypothetical protein
MQPSRVNMQSKYSKLVPGFLHGKEGGSLPDKDIELSNAVFRAQLLPSLPQD